MNDETLFSIGFVLGFVGGLSAVLCLGHLLFGDWLDGPTVGRKR